MISLFKKIRKALLSESKLSQYLLYAIGEIILVMIGILLALQVSNWNTNKQLRASLQAHTAVFTQDLKDDLIKLKDIESSLIDQLASADRLSDQFKQIIPFDQQTISDLSNILLEYRFNPNENGLDLLRNTGEIALMDDDVQVHITDYNNSIKYISERESITNGFINREFEPLFFDRYSTTFALGNTHPYVAPMYSDDRRAPVDIDQLGNIADDKPLEGRILARKYHTTRQLQAYQAGIASIEKLLQELQ